MIEVTGLYFVKRNNNSLEEHDMFFSQRDCKTTNDTSQYVKEFGSTVEFKTFMNQGVETVSDSLTDHFSAGY
jgi:hypothetical protein